ncbi:beta-lactamase/transpeptidase-like protein [Kalaharituber pfeilii]|nr:beta-lactamase/transpeptidase-like protein [Kalaharituber pfeilii]
MEKIPRATGDSPALPLSPAYISTNNDKHQIRENAAECKRYCNCKHHAPPSARFFTTLWIAVAIILAVLTYYFSTNLSTVRLRPSSAHANTTAAIPHPHDIPSPNPHFCLPPLPPHILHTPFSKLPPHAISSFETSKSRLTALLNTYASTTNDTLAIMVVHGNQDGGEELFWWGKGKVKLNATTSSMSTTSSSTPKAPEVSRASIFRIASVTKVFTMLEALILQQRTSTSYSNLTSPRLTLDDDIRLHLPSFSLPAPFTHEPITLRMLGGHTSGLARDVSVGGVNFSVASDEGIIEYQASSNAASRVSITQDIHYLFPHYASSPSGTGDNSGRARIAAPGKCRIVRRHDTDPQWHQCTRQELFELIKQTRLVWRPGEMVSYSNTGFDLLGWSLQDFSSFYDHTTTSAPLLLRDLLSRDVFSPLNMSSSFFHPIPENLKEQVTVPRSEHMVGLDFGEAYDPAGGMYSTPTDLSRFLQFLLSPPSPSSPSLLHPSTIRTWLTPSFPLPNGLSSVGIPWEIESHTFPPLSNPSTSSPIWQVYNKGGALPGHYSQISIVPSLGYAVIALVAVGSGQADIDSGVAKESNPNMLSDMVHSELAASIREAYARWMEEMYVGEYVQYSPSPSSSSETNYNRGPQLGKAAIAASNLESGGGTGGPLYLNSLVTANNVSLLDYLDSLHLPPRIYDNGGKLWPSGIEGEFRIRGGRRPETRPGRRSCREWFGFDEDTTEDGWGADKIIIRKYELEQGNIGGDGSGSERGRRGEGGLELVYEPLGVVFRKPWNR